MRVLLIKTSSMGDVIHTLPALTEAKKAIPSLLLDWVVEENFAEIPSWHPDVNKIIPVSFRRWRKHFFSKQTWLEWQSFRKNLRATQYDLILDAQCLTKSAFLAWNARGVKAGLDSASSRDPFSALFYRKKYSVSPKQHAITRVRKLFCQALGYPYRETLPNYGIDNALFHHEVCEPPYLVFLHGTTWATKHWPDAYWVLLAKIAAKEGFVIKLLWGNSVEKKRAEEIAARNGSVVVLPRLSLKEIAGVLAGAKAIVSVDTGFGHLAAALDVPTVSLYGPTDPVLTGVLGVSQRQMVADFSCAPCLGRVCSFKGEGLVRPACFEGLTPERVWERLSDLMYQLRS